MVLLRVKFAFLLFFYHYKIGLSGGFVSAIPALLWLGIDYSFIALLLWMVSAAFFGLFFAVPLRKYCIIQRQLRFPTGTATAVAVDALFQSSAAGSHGSSERIALEDSGFTRDCKEASFPIAAHSHPALQKASVLMLSLGMALVWTLIGFFIPFLYNAPVFFWLQSLSGISFFAAASNWRWSLNLSPAFVGTGMLMGIRNASSLFLGSLLAFALLGPLFVGVNSVNRMWGMDNPSKDPSAQFWLLWMGVIMMITGSFTEFLLHLPYSDVFNFIVNCKESCSSVVVGTVGRLYQSDEPFRRFEDEPCADDRDVPVQPASRDQSSDTQRISLPSSDQDIATNHPIQNSPDNNLMQDWTSPAQRVPTSWFVSGLIAVVSFTMSILVPFFHLHWYQVILAIVLGFVFSLIGKSLSLTTGPPPSHAPLHCASMEYLKPHCHHLPLC